VPAQRRRDPAPWVIDRSSALGAGIRRAVRLARLMAIADGRDYVRFLYVRLNALRARAFRQLLQSAVAEGRLSLGIAVLSDQGVHLREAALAPQEGDAFEIDFTQMPRLAPCSTFCTTPWDSRSWPTSLRRCWTKARRRVRPTEVARTLQAALNKWLSDRLESSTHLLQARRIRAFLASRGSVAPEAIDDEAILLFWIAMAELSGDERVDGFRLYRSVACAMVRYRQSLRDAAAGRQLEVSLGRGLEADGRELALNAAI